LSTPVRSSRQGGHQQVLAALQPAALELSLQATTQLEQERVELNQLWQQRLSGLQLRQSGPESTTVWLNQKIARLDN